VTDGHGEDPTLVACIRCVQRFPARSRCPHCADLSFGPEPAIDDPQMVASGRRMLYGLGGVAADTERCEDALKEADEADWQFVNRRVGTLDNVYASPENMRVLEGKGERRRFFIQGLLAARLEMRMAQATTAEVRALPLVSSADVDAFIAHLEKAGQSRACALFSLVTSVRIVPRTLRRPVVAAARRRVAEMEARAVGILGSSPVVSDGPLPAAVARTVERLVDTSEDCGELIANLNQRRDAEERASDGAEAKPESEKVRGARDDRLVATLLRRRLDALAKAGSR
jgi:hypothetical protein